MTERSQTVTGGRPPTSGVIPGRFVLSVGKPHREPPPGWTWTPLTDVARLESGHTPSRRHPEYWDGDIPWIGIRDATENHGRVLHDTEQHVTQAGIDHSSARVLPADTVCLSRTASIGYVVVMGRPMATSQDFVNWVCGPRIHPRFLKYALLAEREAFAMFASGTTHQTIYFPEVKAFHICLPPVEEQRRIVGILGALDEKIELSLRMTETLEETTQSLFRSWFLEAESDASYQRGSLADAVELLRDQVDPRLELDTVFQHYSLPAYDAGREPISEPGAGIRSSKFVVPRGSVLLSKLNPEIERVWLPDIRPDDRAICSTEFLVLRPHRDVGRAFVYGFLRSPSFRSTLTSLVTGTTGSHQRAHAEAILRVPVRLPDSSRAAQFELLVGPVLDRAAVARRQSRTLSALRDALLPRLLSGQASSSSGNGQAA